MLENSGSMDRTRKQKFWEMAKDDERNWPVQIKPNIDPYFSQHDLALLGKELVVDEFWKDIPFSNLRETLQRANGLLRL
jgi:hypothetical protein